MKNKKIVSIILILIGSGLFFLNVKGIYSENNSSIKIVFLLNILVWIISIYLLKIDLISIVIFCINALLFPIMIQYYTGKSYGILQQNLFPIHIGEILTFTYLYCVTFLIWAIIFNFKRSESVISHVQVNDYSTLNIAFNNLVAIIFAIVAFPRLGLVTNGMNRFEMLLPGHAWNQLAIVGLLFNLPYLTKRVSVKLTYFFVIFWFLLNGERADITGLILGLICYYFVKNKDIKLFKCFCFFLVSILFLILLNVIVILRNHGQLTLNNAITSIIVTPTLSDVSYLYNVSIDFWQKYGILHGQIFKSDLISIIPFTTPQGFDSIIRYNYFSPGGEPFLSQPLMDWGIVGLIIRSFLDCLLFKLITIPKNSFFKLEFITILCSVPRMVWYGRSYLFSSLFFFIPIIYIINRVIDKNRNRGE